MRRCTGIAIAGMGVAVGTAFASADLVTDFDRDDDLSTIENFVIADQDTITVGIQVFESVVVPGGTEFVFLPDGTWCTDRDDPGTQQYLGVRVSELMCPTELDATCELEETTRVRWHYWSVLVRVDSDMTLEPGVIREMFSVVVSPAPNSNDCGPDPDREIHFGTHWTLTRDKLIGSNTVTIRNPEIPVRASSWARLKSRYQTP